MSRIASSDRFEKLGEEIGGHLAISERFRSRIRNAEASAISLQEGIVYLDSADAALQTVQSILHRMLEVSAAAQNPVIRYKPLDRVIHLQI